jgi:hypothetical protein
MRLTKAAVVGTFLLWVCGCVTQVNMAALPEAEADHTIIKYQSVRDDTRRFPDYSAIGSEILSSPGSAEDTE